MDWTGGCLCGEIRYKIAADPEWAGYCHCTMCRRQTGAPVSVCVQFPREAVEWIKGEPSMYHSQKAARGFCPNCGGTLTWETPSSFTVFVGSLDHAESIKPDSHAYTDTQLPWLVINDNLRRHRSHDDVQWPTDQGYDPATGQFSDSD